MVVSSYLTLSHLPQPSVACRIHCAGRKMMLPVDRRAMLLPTRASDSILSPPMVRKQTKVSPPISQHLPVRSLNWISRGTVSRHTRRYYRVTALYRWSHQANPLLYQADSHSGIPHQSISSPRAFSILNLLGRQSSKPDLTLAAP